MTQYAAELCARGCDGLFVAASTGELPLLDQDERRALIAAARAGCPRDKTLYAGVSGMGVKQSIRYARDAAAEGADAAVIMAPFFIRLDQAELLRFATEIADASPLPVCLYHHLRMPTGFEVATVARLAEHPNIVALKDTSADEQRIGALLAAVSGTKLQVLQGSENLIHQTMQSGGQGCVTALAGIAPEWHRDLLAACRRGDDAEAARQQERITALWKMFLLEGTKRSFGHFLFTLKLAARMRGWIGSAASMVPGFEADAAFERAIEEHLRRCGFMELIAKDRL